MRVAGALLVTAVLACACAAAGPYVTVGTFTPTRGPTTPAPSATAGWWATVSAEMAAGTPVVASTVQPGGSVPGSTPLPGWPADGTTPDLGIEADVTPVTYESLRGRILFRSTRDGFERVYVMDADGGNQSLVYPVEQDFLSQRAEALYEEAVAAQVWDSGQGHQVYVNDAWGRAQLFILRLQDGATWQLTVQGVGQAYDPAWQPSGSLIAFVSNESGNDEVWCISADGTGARQLTRNTWEWDKRPSWSPDGAQIAFWSNRDGHAQVYIMGADGSGQRNLSQNVYSDTDPVWVR